MAPLLMLAGMPMTLDGAAIATTLAGVTQMIARGPVAAMVAIKQLGTNNGSGFEGLGDNTVRRNIATGIMMKQPAQQRLPRSSDASGGHLREQQ